MCSLLPAEGNPVISSETADCVEIVSGDLVPLARAE
jgi:hypothetical protein